ncbi:major facilitator superfamily domain-containing protein 8 [Onthophagus taurus]|uniref:major facilitator superfamily domain-containing protein 8 n=1 Tax=Onthophagus taurus TaxID=166361 RepID=UPI000C20DDE3|nr:major facilitator superfamily domain-containing protein 8 [Onthophagus taurus]XP_022914634.1 major facilitator superfamily domain-containing protein 8 [Onthophagus taurus]XP_022914637.1 major facilitator superfamily domain-containing protein 8 [Onthophagus taurus]
MDYIRRVKDLFKSQKTPFESKIESEIEHKERWRSIYIIYFTMFLISLGFSIILTGVWPYLDKLDPTAGKEFMGYIVAANPFGQMLFSPLVGWWSNKLGSIRIPVLLSLLVFTIASGTYSILELFPITQRKHWMLWTRFLVGVSSANIAACRSYLSAATTISERTKAISMISLCQVLGFIIGPALQTLAVPFGDEGIEFLKLKINMYTAPGWLNVFLSIFNFIIFLPFFFKERKIAAKEAMLKQGAKTEKETWKGIKPDYLSAWTLIVAFFVIVFNFMLLETLGSPLTMDQFAWSKADTVYYMGLLMSVGAVIACVCFAAISPLCKMFPEVKVMIWGGFLFMVLGRGVYIPWGETNPTIYNSTSRLTPFHDKLLCYNHNMNITNTFNKTKFDLNQSNLNFNESNLNLLDCNKLVELVGCPSNQKWCFTTRKMTLFQFLLGYGLTAVGYPIGVTLIQTIFSKILGTRPQGLWMGLMTGSGCFSRVLGPVFVTYIYTEYGPNWTFGITAVMMIMITVWLQIFNNRLEPKKFQEVVHDDDGEEMIEIEKLVEIKKEDVVT